jgi:hypothetical protein
MIAKGLKNIYNKKMSKLSSQTATAGNPQNNRLKGQLTCSIGALSCSPLRKEIGDYLTKQGLCPNGL